MDTRLTKDELIREIGARAPWFQRIEFPEYGVTTTDELAWRVRDGAPDCGVGGLMPDEAERLRPLPKWREIERVLPGLQGLEVLDVGCNCGFFCFEFVRLGARRVVGLDVAANWLDNARFCAEVLGNRQTEFIECDFMTFDGTTETATPGLMGHGDLQVPLPNDLFDVVFMSTVLDHTFFPFLTMYKMLRLARSWVVIDLPILTGLEPGETLMHQSLPPDGSHHGNVFTSELLSRMMTRLGIPPDDVAVHLYNRSAQMTMVVNTSRMATRLTGA